VSGDAEGTDMAVDKNANVYVVEVLKELPLKQIKRT
jgi:hypothetical protein